MLLNGFRLLICPDVQFETDSESDAALSDSESINTSGSSGESIEDQV
jgi:hypothetical protein